MFDRRHRAARILGTLAVGLVLTTAAGPRPGEAAAQQLPETWDGLVLRPSSRVDAVYVQPGAGLGQYDTVMLDDADVSFSKDWDPNRGERGVKRVTPADIGKIRADLAALLREIFTEELGKGGYRVVDEPGETTLLVRPAIVDLYINAVEGSAPGRTYAYTAEAGRMTLVLELRDSATGDVIARAIDRSRARQSGMITMSSRNTNVAEARRMLTRWADLLTQALDEAHGKE